MHMYSIIDSGCNKKEIEKTYLKIKNSLIKEETQKYFNDLDIIFSVAINNLTLFPSKNIREKNISEYITKWAQGYINERLNPPSHRQARFKKSCTDPVLKKMVKQFWQNNNYKMDELEKIHNLFMSAENILGHLLEEFIADKVRPYGWIWCAGETLKAVDFCTTNGNGLLQIKNKSNSENSSSSQIRNNTNIEKWYRLGTQIKKEIAYPKYNWETLEKIINRYACSQAPSFSIKEEEYEAWIMRVIKDNSCLISAL